MFLNRIVLSKFFFKFYIKPSMFSFVTGSWRLVIFGVESILQSQLGGKLLLFQSTLPSLGSGRLKLRGDNPLIYGTEKECLLRVSEEHFYKQMAADFSKYQIAVDTYIFGERYADVASLGESPQLSSLELISNFMLWFYWSLTFQPKKDGTVRYFEK